MLLAEGNLDTVGKVNREPRLACLLENLPENDTDIKRTVRLCAKKSQDTSAALALISRAAHCRQRDLERHSLAQAGPGTALGYRAQKTMDVGWTFCGQAVLLFERKKELNL